MFSGEGGTFLCGSRLMKISYEQVFPLPSATCALQIFPDTHLRSIVCVGEKFVRFSVCNKSAAPFGSAEARIYMRAAWPGL